MTLYMFLFRRFPPDLQPNCVDLRCCAPAVRHVKADAWRRRALCWRELFHGSEDRIPTHCGPATFRGQTQVRTRCLQYTSVLDFSRGHGCSDRPFLAAASTAWD